MSEVKLLALSGSMRTGSFNQRLIDQAAAIASDAGATVTCIKLADFALPLFAADPPPEDFPVKARELKTLFIEHDGVLIASPEHNGSVSAALKNAIDWASRPTGDEHPVALTAFRGKIIGLMSASTGPFGGLRGLLQLRQILGTVQALVATEQVCVPFADQAFDGPLLRDALPSQLLPGVVNRVIQLCRAAV